MLAPPRFGGCKPGVVGCFCGGSVATGIGGGLGRPGVLFVTGGNDATGGGGDEGSLGGGSLAGGGVLVPAVVVEPAEPEGGGGSPGGGSPAAGGSGAGAGVDCGGALAGAGTTARLPFTTPTVPLLNPAYDDGNAVKLAGADGGSAGGGSGGRGVTAGGAVVVVAPVTGARAAMLTILAYVPRRASTFRRDPLTGRRRTGIVLIQQYNSSLG